MRRMRLLSPFLGAALLLVCTSMLTAAEDSPAIKDFKQRIGKYVELHNKVKGPLDPQKKVSDPAELAQQTANFAKAMQAARPAATQGDFFTPQVKPVFLRIIKQELRGAANAKARSMVLGEGNPKSSEEPKTVVPLKVNARYPTKAPKSTVPPSLLLALPELPKELEYRFVGKTLILTDADADIIVDFLPQAVP